MKRKTKKKQKKLGPTRFRYFSVPKTNVPFDGIQKFTCITWENNDLPIFRKQKSRTRLFVALRILRIYGHRSGPEQAVQLIAREKRVYKIAIFHTPHAAAAAVATRRIEKKMRLSPRVMALNNSC